MKWSSLLFSLSTQLQNDGMQPCFGHGQKAQRQCQTSSACTRPTFAHSVIISVVIPELGCTQLVFMKSGTKIIRESCRDELLSEFLPAIQSFAEVYIFQQDNALARRACQTASLWNSRINCSWQVATEQHGPLSSWLLHTRSDAIMNLSNTCHHRMWQIRGSMLMSVADKTTDQWWKRLDASVHVQGGHFEQLLWYCLSHVSSPH